jgi:hypothetical protein
MTYDRSFFMTPLNADTVHNMTDGEFAKFAKRKLAELRLQLRVAKTAVRARLMADRKGIPLKLEAIKDGIDTKEKCLAALAELKQKMEAM